MSEPFERVGSLWVPAQTKQEIAESAIDPPDVCALCGDQWVSMDAIEETSVGYESPPGHSHDDNCMWSAVVCERGHRIRGSIQRTCPVCDWKGDASCTVCGGGPKWTRWPAVNATAAGSRDA